MAEGPLVSFLIITRNRKEELECALRSVLAQEYRPFEVVVVDNESADGTGDLLKREYEGQGIRYLRLDENRGVAGGRNEGIRHCTGDIVVCVDDDAVVESPGATRIIVEKMLRDERLAVLALKIVNYYTGEMAREEFPHRDKSLDPDRPFETTYFLGGACALRKSVFDQVGGYPEDFFYGLEELDLSFRILDAGYGIAYCPEVVILHRKSPKARRRAGYLWSKNLENRIRVTMRHLPWFYVMVSTLVWSGYVLLKCRGNPLVLVRAYWNVARNIPALRRQRRPVGGDTLERLKALKGRLLY